MRLLADEDFDHRCVERLRGMAHDVVTVMQAGRRSASDAEISGAPVGHDRREPAPRMAPLAVRTARPPDDLFTAERNQPPGNVAVLHAASTTNSSEIDACRACSDRLAGSARPDSS